MSIMMAPGPEMSPRTCIEGVHTNLPLGVDISFDEDDFPDVEPWELDGVDYDDFSDINPHELGGPSPLLHLPVELFTMIMEYCVQAPNLDSLGDLKTHRQYLRCLRLVHPCLNCHSPLQQELARIERTVVLTPAMEQLCNLEDRLPMISPFVRKVVFKPARVLRGDLDKKLTATSRTMRMRKLKETSFGVRVNKMSSILRRLPKAREVWIKTRPDQADKSSYGVGLKEPIACMVATNIAPRCILFDLVAIEVIDWKQLLWQAIDLSRLDTVCLFVKFQGLPQSRNDHFALQKKEMVAQLMAFISKLAQNVERTLRTLTISYGDLEWTSESRLPQMSQLRRLTLIGVGICPSMLYHWLQNHPAVNELTLIDVDPVRNGFSVDSWRHLFTAIRRHHGPLAYYLDLVCFTKYHHSGRLILSRGLQDPPFATPRLVDGACNDANNEIISFLHQYMLRLCQWDRVQVLGWKRCCEPIVAMSGSTPTTAHQHCDDCENSRVFRKRAAAAAEAMTLEKGFAHEPERDGVVA